MHEWMILAGVDVTPADHVALRGQRGSSQGGVIVKPVTTGTTGLAGDFACF